MYIAAKRRKLRYRKADKRKLCAAGKSGSLPRAVQRGGSAPPRFLSVFFAVPFGRALGFGARERSERVTVRRQPHRQLRRRLV